MYTYLNVELPELCYCSGTFFFLLTQVNNKIGDGVTWGFVLLPNTGVNSEKKIGGRFNKGK